MILPITRTAFSDLTQLNVAEARYGYVFGRSNERCKTAGLLTDRLTYHEKQVWMMKSMTAS
jgi:DNA-binding ferritin-like protein